MLNDITIIIPTHERHQYLKRSLEYWSELKYSLIVADSSKNPFDLKNINSNIVYLHCPKLSLTLKLSETLRQVYTEYAVLCADDDFITSTGIDSCIKFLNQSDYVCAKGKAVSFKKTNDREYRWGMSESNIGSICEESPVLRYKNHSNNFQSIFYAVTRTKVLSTAWDNANKYTNDGRFAELLASLYIVIQGKVKVIDVFYHARESIINSDGTSAPTMFNFILNRTFDIKYDLFKNCMAQNLMKKTDLGYHEVSRLLDINMNAYLKNSQGYSLKILKYKAIIKSMFLEYGLNLLLSKIRNIRKSKLAKKWTELVEIPYVNPSHKQYEEWVTIDNIIKKFNI